MESAARAGSLVGIRSDAFPTADNLHRLALEASPSGMLMVGPAGSIALVNHALEQQFGYTRDELIGQSIEVLLPESFQDFHPVHSFGYVSKPEAGSPGVGRELLGRRKDGSQIRIEVGVNEIQTPAGVFLLASVIDITERSRREAQQLQALNDLMEFRRLVAELSAKFVNLAADEIDDAIRDGQRRIVEALGLDRSALFQISGDEEDFILTHHWEGPDVQRPPANVQISAKSDFPWTLAKIRRGEAATFSSAEEVPDPVERETLTYYRTKSRVAIPISIGDRIAGVISFASTREAISWPADILNHLHLVAQVFSSALARKQADTALRHSEQRFRNLADNAPVMIWVSGRDKLCTWSNRKWLEFVGRTMEQESGNGWAVGVHPEDLNECLRIYMAAFDQREPFSMEYRLRRHDGEWRWVFDQGSPNYTGNGTFEGYIGSCVDVTEQKEAQLQLQGALAEVENRHNRLRTENSYLRREVQERLGTGPVVGKSTAIRRVLDQIEQVAGTDSTVLLLGETGTGKELFATLIHQLSARQTHSMVRVNCAAIPSPLIESELFGREKGAYTGALTRQIGRFELADQSTIFLDEIGDLPPEVQVKLLRVLEERQFERLGSTKAIRVNTRVIAATHRNLEQRITNGEFREDLFYRINVFPIYLPPLRDRREDIPLLVWRFVAEFSKAFGKQIEAISRENMNALQDYSWPGNVRELRNVVERAMIVATTSRLTIALPPQPAGAGKHYIKLDDVEREHIKSVLEGTGWRIRGAGGAADRLGFKPTTLETRMVKLGLKRPKPS